MNFTVLSEFVFSETIVQYLRDEQQRVGFRLFPQRLKDKIVEHRADLRDLPEFKYFKLILPAVALDPLVHLKTAGQISATGYAQGRTMRNAPELEQLCFKDQRVRKESDRTVIVTILTSPLGYSVEHELTWFKDENAGEIRTTFCNNSAKPVTLEFLTSFSLGGITPFAADDAPECLYVHRLRSTWSAEGRLTTEAVEDLQLEPSWTTQSPNTERFGQVGSMPVKQFFPFVAVEDREAGVLWGAQIAWAGSWQMEVYRRDDWLAISGGLADREFGHWTKSIRPGERFISPRAIVACVQGDIDDLSHALTHTHARALESQPAIERDLPIQFNEWCTSWGNPNHENLIALADRLKGTDVKYLIIDAGWYKDDRGDWGSSQGEWLPNPKQFPHGIEATTAAIRERGLIPGLWFEPEVVCPLSPLFERTEWFLKRDGVPIASGGRRFLDLNNPDVIAHLTERVVGLLERAKFGYMKVDYNDTIGVGCDGAESPGEGLRRQIEGIYRFYEMIRRRLPDLVMEMCSSGGHRLEPSLLGIGALGSYSDAHESPEIPILGANVQRAILPRQCSMLTVLRKEDSDRRLTYSLAAGFLGRLCLSGDLHQLNPQQWQLVNQATRLYRQAVPIIRDGLTRQHLHRGRSFRHPTGWQGIVRTAHDGRSALVVLHSFAQSPAGLISVPLPAGRNWRSAKAFCSSQPPVVRDQQLHYDFGGAFGSCVALLQS